MNTSQTSKPFIMKNLFKSPKTTFGALLLLAGLGMFITKNIDANTMLGIVTLAGAWIGLTAKDFNKSGK